MRILMVTPYPPVRDGIAAYAVQEVARLRAEGHDVEVLSPGPSAAHHHLNLVGPRGALALAKRVRRYDRVIIQFHPDVFFPVPASTRDWAVGSLALAAALGWARDVEVRIHEIDYRRGGGRPLLRLVNRLPWRLATRVVVHTHTERDNFSTAFGVPVDRIEVGQHGAHFRRFTTLSQAEARASLHLPDEDLVFLNIGFIQPHKGFDRAVRAVADLSARGLDRGYRLDVVGSVRTNEVEHLSYMAELRSEIAATPNVYLHEGYLSDELFDRWLVACDVVVLPYRTIWSSGVLERALLYQRRVIATDVGGLGYQRADRDEVSLVEDDAELRHAMADLVSAHTGEAISDLHDPPVPWTVEGPVTRQAVQAQVRDRAAQHRPSGAAAVAGPSLSGVRGGSASRSAASAPVRRVSPVVLPAPQSKRLGGVLVKKLAGRLTWWEIEPLVTQVNALREATIRALEIDRGSSAGD